MSVRSPVKRNSSSLLGGVRSGVFSLFSLPKDSFACLPKVFVSSSLLLSSLEMSDPKVQEPYRDVVPLRRREFIDYKTLSHRMYLLIGFRKSTPPQNRQLNIAPLA